MGITIHYRGRIDDMSRIEDFENQVVNAIFALGGKPTIWRSYADGNPGRVIRGVMAHMAEGVDTLSLLVAPEGDLIPLFDIEQVEKKAFDEPPWCFVKTQFGSPISHACIVFLLEAIRERYVSSLEVRDESGYYEHHNFELLVHQTKLLSGLLAQFSSSIANHGQMSHEAAEDPSIVALRIERIAKLVHTNFAANGLLSREADSLMNDDLTEIDFPDDPSLEEEVAWFERHRRKDDLNYQMFRRRLGEALADGKSPEEAFRDEQRRLDAEMPLDDGGDDSSWRQLSEDAHEPWAESLAEEISFRETDAEQADAGDEQQRGRHPAVELASEVIVRLFKLKTDPRTEDPAAGNFLDIAFSGAMDCAGGLAQATHQVGEWRLFRALAISQLRRALSGHAFLRGAVFALQSENVITSEEANEIHEMLAKILEHIHQLSADAWDEK